MYKHPFLEKIWPLMIIFGVMQTMLVFLQLRVQGVLYDNALMLALLDAIPSSLCAYLLSYVLLPLFINRRQILFFFLVSVLTCLVISSLAVYFGQPLLCRSFNTVLSDPAICSFRMLFPGYFIGLIFSSGTLCGIRFYQEYARTRIDHEHLRTTHLEAELTLLRDQVNPHFVFNMMNSIHVLIEKDARQAADMVLEFSDMLRYQLYDCSKPFIPLQQEIVYLQNYVNIENKRRGNELKVDCNWGITTPLCHISPLILTPFVENAFKHVSRFPDKHNFIRIDLVMEDEKLFFIVENSKEKAIPMPDPSPRHKGIGLVNVQKRLALLYPEQHILRVEETADQFAIFLEVKINCL
ncbi:sensor histidine kinase [Chitinophaga nivalis]|uniref:Histidine kinase n=1 Tax=Chitinophaga nivalis TaxID=2991709 RepID=A0ABT3IK19_9BACT|nr:histidine kinase [Chitinophaga nivalis]MCW3466205.1 histidine kinase [Chitinophaga nivalis]MCW3484104.1 histidine kinase [Chitinophaga nivalis]